MSRLPIRYPEREDCANAIGTHGSWFAIGMSDPFGGAADLASELREAEARRVIAEARELLEGTIRDCRGFPDDPAKRIQLTAAEWLLGYWERTEQGTLTPFDRETFPEMLELLRAGRGLEGELAEDERAMKLLESFGGLGQDRHD